MDPINSGASIIAFLGLTLQCTKTLIDFIGSIKDGPEHVKRAANMVLHLQQNLNQLSSRRAVLEATDRQAVESRLKDCSDDLRPFVSKLKMLQFSETEVESRGRRVWKRIRTAFSEKDLEVLTDVVGTHSSSLGLWLQSDQSELIHSISDAVSSQGQQFPAVRTQLSTINDSIVDARDDLAQFDQQLRQEAVDTRTRLDRIEGEIREATTERSASEGRQRQGLATIQSKLDEATAICLEMEALRYARLKQESQAHIENLQSVIRGALDSFGLSLVEQLQQRFGGIHTGNTEQRHTATNRMGRNGDRMIEGRLLQSLERLCELVNVEGQTVAAEEVDTILEDLKTVLRAALERNETAEIKRKLMHVEKAIYSVPKLPLNQKDIREPLPRGIVKRESSEEFAECYFPDGILDIFVKKAKYFPVATPDGHGDHTHEDHARDTRDREHADFLEVLKMQLKYIRKRSRRQVIVLMKFTQHIYGGGKVISIPQLSVNRILPNSSAVFHVISKGDFFALKRMLQEGQASLRDHDEYGNSLLALAVVGAQPDICRFLLDCGADVDVYYNDTHRPVPILTETLFHDHLDAHNARRFFQCFKYLVESGVDPTDTTGNLPSAVEYAFATYDVCFARFLLDYQSPFINGISAHVYGDNIGPFLVACGLASSGLSVPLFKFLLSRGASIFDRDHCGRTCLHSCFERSFHDVTETAQDRDGILFLIKNGADIRAKDYFGRTVSHFARHLTNPDQCEWHVTYNNDLWDAVLTICGFDITEFGGDTSRPAYYGEDYDIDSFRLLWMGYESLCPYPERLYDDTDDPDDELDQSALEQDPAVTMMGNEDEESEERIAQASSIRKEDGWQDRTEDGEDSVKESPESLEDSDDEEQPCKDLNCDYCRRLRHSMRGPRRAMSEPRGTTSRSSVGSGNTLSTDFEEPYHWLRDGESQHSREEVALAVIGEDVSQGSLEDQREIIKSSVIGVLAGEESGQWPVGDSSPIWTRVEFENPWIEE